MAVLMVTGNAADLREEANFLQGIGVRVTVITRQELDGLDPGIGHRTARSMAIQGDGRLEGFVADGEQIPCDVVFVLREVMAPDALVPGLELDGRFVKVNRRQETNIPGLYAAGDCTGKPLQIAKAIKISRKCIGIVYQNIVFALMVKFACLALVALGAANMWAAIFADVGVMVLAVLNAIRALRVHNL